MSEFNRRALYKNNDRDFENQRRNRNDHSVEIRKAKKEDQLQKRRNINLESSPEPTPTKEKEKDLSISDIKTMLMSKDIPKMIEAAVCSRKKLSKEKNPPIDQFMKAGLVPLLVSALGGHDEETLTFEAAWALTNIASGESKHTAAVVEANAVPIFIKLMNHRSDQIAEQSIWAISNITGDSAKNRDLVIKNGIVEALKMSMMRFWSSVEILRHTCWLVSNLCRHKSRQYPTSDILELLPLVREVLVQVADNRCSIDLAWALTYACDSRDEIIDAMIGMDLLTVVNGYLADANTSNELIAPALRAMGNVVAGSDTQADAAIQCGLLTSLKSLLANQSSSPRVVKETCWVISNICAGSVSQVSTVIESGLMNAVMQVLRTGDFKSQKEAAWAVSNVVSGASDDHRFWLLNANVFDAIVPMLACDDVTIVLLLLDATRDLFKCADSVGQLEPCVDAFEQVGGIDAIEVLQQHDSNDVYNKSYEIVKEYLGGEEEDEGEETNEAPADPATDKYKF